MLPWELLGLLQGKGVFFYQGLAKKLPGGLHLHSFFLHLSGAAPREWIHMPLLQGSSKAHLSFLGFSTKGLSPALSWRTAGFLRHLSVPATTALVSQFSLASRSHNEHDLPAELSAAAASTPMQDQQAHTMLLAWRGLKGVCYLLPGESEQPSGSLRLESVCYFPGWAGRKGWLFGRQGDTPILFEAH